MSFTFKNNQIEGQAKAYAENKISDAEENFHDRRNEEEVKYLDSLSNYKVEVDGKNESLKVFNLGVSDFTYEEVKENALNLGLDLKGGLNVILQVSVKDILKGLANNSTNPVFNKALDDASELQKDTKGWH